MRLCCPKCCEGYHDDMDHCPRCGPTDGGRAAETDRDIWRWRFETLLARLEPGPEPNMSHYTIQECQNGKFDLHYALWLAKEHFLHAAALEIAVATPKGEE